MSCEIRPGRASLKQRYGTRRYLECGSRGIASYGSSGPVERTVGPRRATTHIMRSYGMHMMFSCAGAQM